MENHGMQKVGVMGRVREVVVPSTEVHEGRSWNRMRVRLVWVCPQCGGPRGAPIKGISYDGSRRLYDVDLWENPCEHVDAYGAVREEAHTNGLNTTPLKV